MDLSISSFVYYNYPLDEAIQRAAKAGYKGIDVWGGRPHAYRQDLRESEIAHLVQVIEGEGMEVASFIPAQFRYPTSLCSPNDVIREDSVRYIQDSIDTAAAIGAPVVSVCPGHTLFGQSKEDALQRLAESLEAIASFADRHDVRIALEPADAYETDIVPSCRAARDFLSPLGRDNLGVLLDNGHEVLVHESPAAAIELLGEALFHVHLDDNNGLRDQHLVPGEGNFDFPPFLRTLQKSGYQGYLCLELGWDYTLDPDTAASLSVKRLKSIFERL